MNTSVLKLRKLVASFSVATLLASLLVVPAMAAVPAQFSWAEDAAMAYGDADKFNELGNTMNKCEFSKIVATALGLEETMPSPYPFTDVADWAKGYVGALYTAEIVEGRTATFFGCAEPVTRAEMVVMLDRAYNWSSVVTTPATLTPAQEAEFANVMWAKDAFRRGIAGGVVTGNADGSLKPGQAAVKAEGFVVAYRAAGSPEVEGDDEEPTRPGRDTSFDENGGSEGSIDDVTVGSREESEALEGEEEVEIYALDFELDDEGPLQLQRLDVVFEADGAGDSSKPWDYFTEVSIAVEGEVVATMDTDSSSDWSDKLSGNLDADEDADFSDDDGDEYRLRFVGLEETLVSDESTKVSVMVTVMDTLDSDDEDTTWFIGATEARVMDETGVVTTEDLTDFTGWDQDDFGLGAEETADLDFSESKDSPDASVIEVSETSDTDDVVIYAFEIEETEGVTATLETLTATITTTGTVNEGSVVKDVHLRLVGEDDPIATESVPNGGAIEFDNLGLEIEGDSTVELEVVVDLKDNDSGTAYVEGTTIAVVIDAVTEVTDDNGNDEDDINVDGLSLPSETHSLRSSGLMLEFVSASSQRTTSDTAGVNETVEFTLTFKATAFGDDIYVDKTCAVGTTGTDVDAVEVSLDGDTDGSSTTCTDVDSTGDEETEGFEVLEGQTETFTVTVLGNGGEAAGAGNPVTFRARLNGVGYNIGSDGVGDTVYAFDLTDYKSSAVTVYDR